MGNLQREMESSGSDPGGAQRQDCFPVRILMGAHFGSRCIAVLNDPEGLAFSTVRSCQNSRRQIQDTTCERPWRSSMPFEQPTAVTNLAFARPQEVVKRMTAVNVANIQRGCELSYSVTSLGRLLFSRTCLRGTRDVGDVRNGFRWRRRRHCVTNPRQDA